jgi:hypothetical protein
LSEQVFQDEQGNSVISTGTELQLKEFVSIALFPDLDSQTQLISITSPMLFKVLFQTRNPVHVLSSRALGRKRWTWECGRGADSRCHRRGDGMEMWNSRLRIMLRDLLSIQQGQSGIFLLSTTSSKGQAK